MSQWIPVDRLKKIEWNRITLQMRVWHKGEWRVFGDRVSMGLAGMAGQTFLRQLRREDEEADTANGLA
jgi:hypothetical protein